MFIDFRDANGNNLLAASIWRKDVFLIEEQPEMLSKDDTALEYIESDDDDDTIQLKHEKNKAAMSYQSYPSNGAFTDEYYEKQQHEFDLVFDYLLANGADYHLVNSMGANLIHEVAKLGNFSIFQKLLNMGVNSNLVDSLGNTPLHYVITLDIFDELNRCHPNQINTQNEKGRSPLMEYFNRFEKSTEIVERMIAAGTNLNITDCDGNTALHYAAAKIPKLAEILLRNSANINAENNQGEIPAHKLNLNYYRPCGAFKLFICHELINLLTTSKRKFSLLTDLVSMSDKDLADVLPELLKRQSQFDELFRLHCNSFDYHGVSCLQYASVRSKAPWYNQYSGKDYYKSSNSYCFMKLLDQQNINTRKALAGTETLSDVNVLKLLISKGADVNVKDQNGLTPLLKSTGAEYRTASVECVKVLLKAGANCDTSVKDLRPLDIAGTHYNRKKSTAMLAILLQFGAKYRYSTNDGIRPLDNSVFKCFYDFDEE